jgi:hypothetical protein
MGSTGDIMSFNYEVLQQTNSNVINANPNQFQLPEFQGVGYMNNLDYTICFRKEQFFCSQSYSVFNISSPVQALNEQIFSIRSSQVSEGNAGTGIAKCSQDYLLLNGKRLCGYRLNANAVDQNLGFSETVTDERLL